LIPPYALRDPLSTIVAEKIEAEGGERLGSTGERREDDLLGGTE